MLHLFYADYSKCVLPSSCFYFIPSPYTYSVLERKGLSLETKKAIGESKIQLENRVQILRLFRQICCQDKKTRVQGPQTICPNNHLEVVLPFSLIFPYAIP